MRPWLYRITLNAALDIPVRARDRGHPVPRRLPEHQRQAFVLREVYGLSVKDIAVELGLTTAGVQRALFAARSRLAEAGPPARHQPVSAKPPHSGRRSSVLAVLAAGAALVALCVGVPIAATVTPAEGGDPPTLAVPPANRAL